jgi:putative flippase GtrA
MNLRDYVSKQLRFSFGNVLSVPVGTALLFAFTQYLHVWYVESSLLSLMVTTIMNFWVQVALKVVRLRKS